jgi:C-terminal processing protease CtpA/Prc
LQKHTLTPSSWRQSKRDISWERLPEHPDIIHLTIRSFHPEQERKFKRELKHCFQAIYRAEKKSENAITGIVLDLRQNSGGHIALMAEVLPYLVSEATRIPYGAQIKHSDIARDQLSHPWIGGSVFSFRIRSKFHALEQSHSGQEPT